MRNKGISIFGIPALCVTAICLACACGTGIPAEAEEQGANRNMLTFQEVLEKGITTFIDKELRLKGTFTWSYATAKIPEDPTPQEVLRKRAGRLGLSFEGPAFANVKGKKYLHVVESPAIRKVDSGGREAFAFKDLTLSRGNAAYAVTARLRLRPTFNASHLENPAFVKQSNNPRYWTQTFEVEILNVEELKNAAPEAAGAGIEVSCRNPQDTCRVTAAGNLTVLAITSPKGIGGATVTLKQGQRPGKMAVTLRYAPARPFKGLEGFSLTCGDIVLRTRLGAQDTVAPENGKPPKKYHMPVALHEDGDQKTVRIQLPPDLPGDKAAAVTIDWVDHYR